MKVLEFPTSILNAIDEGSEGGESFVHDHLLRLLRHSDRLPAVTVRIGPLGVGLLRGHQYLRVAKELSRSIPAILTSDSLDPEQCELTAGLRVIEASEYMADPPPSGYSWHVLGFAAEGGLDSSVVREKIAGVLEVVGAHLEKFTFDVQLRCAECYIKIPSADERGIADLVRGFLGLPGLTTYQGRRIT